MTQASDSKTPARRNFMICIGSTLYFSLSAVSGEAKGARLAPCPSFVCFDSGYAATFADLAACEGCLGLDGEGGEAGGVVGGDVGEDLAVEAVAGQLEAVDEGRVAHAVQLAAAPMRTIQRERN